MAVAGYNRVLDRIAAAAERSGREPSDVVLVAVSKERSMREIGALYDAGHRDFGENRADEMAEKAEQMPADIRWHFVGSLQSNKSRLVRNLTHLLHSMDRMSLAKAWVKGLGEPPPVMIQVNIGREEQKGGVLPEETGELAAKVAGLGVSIRGLMAIPPLGDVAEDSREYFVALRSVRDSLLQELPGATGLSMGMTNDFEVAIEEGASIIRVGRAIFDTTLDRE